MKKYKVFFEVRAAYFGGKMMDQSIEVFAEDAREAKKKVEEFAIKNAREVDPDAQYFYRGLLSKNI